MKTASIQPKVSKQTTEKTKKSNLRVIPSPPITPIATPFLELYQKENCPFSHAVRNRLTQLGIDFVSHTVPDGHLLKHRQLTRAGGRDQIPLLIDHKAGVRLYDSAAIIGYLENEYGTPKKGKFNQWAHSLDLRLQTQLDQMSWALRAPFERAQEVVDDLTKSWTTLKRSYQVIKKTVMGPLPTSKGHG